MYGVCHRARGDQRKRQRAIWRAARRGIGGRRRGLLRGGRVRVVDARARDPDLERVARHRRHHDRRRGRPRLRQERVQRLSRRGASVPEMEAPLRLHAHQVRGRDDSHAHHRLQRSALHGGPAGDIRARLESLALRHGVRLHFSVARVRRIHPRSQVHRYQRDNHGAVHQRVHAREGASPGDWRHRSCLPDQEPRRHRRGVGTEADR